jgi:branched-subunit amino acid transport protein
MALITFALRFVFFAGQRGRPFPRAVERALTFVPVAVLTAIIVPMLLLPDGQHWWLHWRNPWIVGALVTGAIALRVRDPLPAVVGGLLTFFTWQWLAG